jgi:hypothetical protein
MVATISKTESQAFTALRSWIKDVLPAAVEVVRGDNNRVPSPKNDFVVLSHINKRMIEWPTETYTDDFVETLTITGTEVITNTQPIDFSIQVDCYGANSGDYSTMLAILWSTSQACSFLDPLGIQPLYMDDPKHVPFIDGEKQYEERWVTTAHLQYNPAVSTAMQFTSTAEVEIVNVDRTYPA